VVFADYWWLTAPLRLGCARAVRHLSNDSTAGPAVAFIPTEQRAQFQTNPSERETREVGAQWLRLLLHLTDLPYDACHEPLCQMIW